MGADNPVQEEQEATSGVRVTWPPPSAHDILGNIGIDIHRSNLYDILLTNSPHETSRSNLSPIFMMKQVEDLINKKLKEQCEIIMTTLRDRTSNLFTISLVSIKILKDVIARVILK